MNMNSRVAFRPVRPLSGLGADDGSVGQVAIQANKAIQLFNPHRRCACCVTNLGTIDIYIGFNSQVTTDTGQLIVGVKGASISFETHSPVWAIAASDARVSWLEYEK